jgi:hypothetical protein
VAARIISLLFRTEIEIPWILPPVSQWILIPYSIYFLYLFSFATREKNGLLFYNGRYNEKHDFVALEIINGQVQFSFSLGSNITSATAYVKGGVHDGNWHEVSVDYLSRVSTLVYLSFSVSLDKEPVHALLLK